VVLVEKAGEKGWGASDELEGGRWLIPECTLLYTNPGRSEMKRGTILVL
jgi:hypothetical protein